MNGNENKNESENESENERMKVNESSGSENESLNGNENAYLPFEKKSFEPMNNLKVMETTEYLRPRATRCSNTQSRSIHHTTILIPT